MQQAFPMKYSAKQWEKKIHGFDVNRPGSMLQSTKEKEQSCNNSDRVNIFKERLTCRWTTT